MRRSFHRALAIEGVVDTVVALAPSTDVYVGVVPRRRRGGRRDDLLRHASVVWVDCDTDKSVAALDAFRPPPAIVVATGSGKNRHAYWLLRDAVELDVIEQTNRRLATAVGGDTRSIDAARILRPAGSLNRKHSPPVPVLLVACETRRCALGELDAALPRAETKLEPTVCGQPGTALADPLRLVSPRVYVERLTGQRVGRSGKVRCPFHDDATPSLHVYEDAQRGWYCFGCGRGGSIYDLGAPLLRRGTRGEDFVKLRRELAAIVR